MTTRFRPPTRRRNGSIRARRTHAQPFAGPYRTAAPLAELEAPRERIDPAPFAACAVAIACAFAVLTVFGLGWRAVIGVSASVALLGAALDELVDGP